MIFVPLLLLERAPEPASTGGGAVVGEAVASARANADPPDRGPQRRVQRAMQDRNAADGLQATTPIGADDPAVAAAVPPPVVDVATTTTTAPPEPTTTTTTATTVAPAKALRARRGHNEAGQASWYQTFDTTCAHRTLPFGTTVTIIRLDTGATATCRVSDRGPEAPERVIDLDYDTFALLADPQTGLIDVRLQW